MGLLDFFKRKESKALKGYTPQSMEGVIFYDSFGRVIGNGLEGFKYLTSSNKKPSIYENTKDAFGMYEDSYWISRFRQPAN